MNNERETTNNTVTYLQQCCSGVHQILILNDRVVFLAGNESNVTKMKNTGNQTQHIPTLIVINSNNLHGFLQ
jgi:hypothetical protein